MDYEQARAFIRETGQYGIVYGLDGIRNLMVRLGNVQEQLFVLHVAGTNGKGSVCAMLAGILTAAGYRTGVYASPAVCEPEEIIKVNGKNISRPDFARLAKKVQAACMDMQKEGLPHPTAFEVETAIAFCFFREEKCDYVVLEAGLGGAEDATNLVMHPVCSVLTSISMDHMGFLGNTLEEIAAAKAGIIKPGCPCVSAEQKPQVLAVLKKAAAEKGSMLRIADGSCIRSFSCDGQKSRFTADIQPSAGAYADGKQETQALAGGCPDRVQETQALAGGCPDRVQGTLGLAGACQKENLACVLEAVRLLRESGIQIAQEAVLSGLADVQLPGRLEKIAGRPDFYIDGAHNEGAVLCLRETVRSCFADRRLVCIIGVFADKEYEKLLHIMLPYAAQVFTVTPPHPRALDGEALARLAGRFHPKAAYVPGLAQAALLAKNAAGEDGVVLAFGSFSYLEDLKTAVIRQE